MSTLVVSEVFGPTLQGEGPHSGRPVGFVRLGACNLTCSWCDTPYTWDADRFDLKAELSRVDVPDVLSALLNMRVPTVVLSGGEPLLQSGQQGFTDLLIGLHRADVSVHVETNGTIVPKGAAAALVKQFVVSPKLSNSGVQHKNRHVPEALTWFADRARKHADVAFKFVVRDSSDLDEVRGVVDAYAIPDHSVWIMPEGIEAEDVLTGLVDVADDVIVNGWNLCTRLHVVVWGNRRGV